MIKNILLEKHRRHLIFIAITVACLWLLANYGPREVIDRPLHAHLFLKLTIITPLILLFFPRSVFKPWAWFSAIYLPLTAMWIIFIAPISATQWFTTKDELSDIFGVLYLAVSILIAVSITLLQRIRGKK